MGLGSGHTYWFLLEYVNYQRDGLVVTRTTPVAITFP